MPSGDIGARVFENSQTGLLLLERATGRILEVNAAFLRTYLPLAGTHFPALPVPRMDTLRAAMDLGAAKPFETLLGGGTCYLVATPVVDSGPGCLALFHYFHHFAIDMLEHACLGSN